MTARRASLMRMVGLGVVLSAAVIASGLNSTRARALAVLGEVGEQVARFAGDGSGNEPRTLRINGLLLHLATSTQAAPIDDVLDDAKRGCAVTLRGSTPARGQLGCLYAGGRVRFVRAAREPGATSTFVIDVWSDGALQLSSAFPRTGDAPGRDPSDLPRPQGARRILSATQDGATQSLTLYRRTGSARDALRNDYRRALERTGFVITASRAAPQSWLARRGADAFLITFGSDTDAVLVLASQL